VLEDGSIGRAAVPSGASTGAHEAVELRDGDKKRYLGKGVQKAVAAVNGEIFDAMLGLDAEDQRKIDAGDDRTRRHAEQGAPWRQRHPRRVAGGGQGRRRCNRGLPLYRYVGGCQRAHPAVPMMNIINGGAHADNPIDIQEFMIMPVGADRRRRRAHGRGSFHTLKKRLSAAGHNTNVGDEGGFAPNSQERRRSARLHHEVDRRPATSRARTSCSRSIAPRPSSSRTASTSWKARASRSIADQPWSQYSRRSRASAIPIVSIEDGMSEDDLGRLEGADRLIGNKCQLVGDDLFVTNPVKRLERASRRASPIHPRQGQPDRHADRDAWRPSRWHSARLHGRDVAPLGRDRGLDHRGSRGRHQLRADQDRLAVALGPPRPNTTSSSASRRNSENNKHSRGAIAMARGEATDSGQSTVYIDLAENTGLGATPGAPPNTTGYAVFGHVVQGMDIVDAIAGVELAPPAEKHPFPGKLPLTPVVIKKATVIKE
jgi:phosphopyruvate hydratase